MIRLPLDDPTDNGTLGILIQPRGGRLGNKWWDLLPRPSQMSLAHDPGSSKQVKHKNYWTGPGGPVQELAGMLGVIGGVPRPQEKSHPRCWPGTPHPVSHCWRGDTPHRQPGAGRGSPRSTCSLRPPWGTPETGFRSCGTREGGEGGDCHRGGGGRVCAHLPKP